MNQSLFVYDIQQDTAEEQDTHDINDLIIVAKSQKRECCSTALQDVVRLF